MKKWVKYTIFTYILTFFAMIGLFALGEVRDWGLDTWWSICELSAELQVPGQAMYWFAELIYKTKVFGLERNDQSIIIPISSFCIMGFWFCLIIKLKYQF